MAALTDEIATLGATHAVRVRRMDDDILDLVDHITEPTPTSTAAPATDAWPSSCSPRPAVAPPAHRCTGKTHLATELTIGACQAAIGLEGSLADLVDDQLREG